MQSVLKYILLTAVRDRLYIGLLVILIAAFGISAILGSTSIVEANQTSIVFIAGSSRIIFALGIILFTCFYVRRSFDNKEVEFILSKSISRHSLVFAYLLGFLIVALFIFIPIVVVLVLAKVKTVGLLIWLASILIEIFILIAFALLSSLILKNAVSCVLASLGFYVLARMMAFFVLSIDIPTDYYDFNSVRRSMGAFLKYASFAFPRLDLVGQSDWLIYDIESYKKVMVVFVQGLIYVPLLTFMSFYDFNKKQF